MKDQRLVHHGADKVILDEYTQVCLLFLLKPRKRPVTLPSWVLITIEEELEPKDWVQREGSGWGLTPAGKEHLQKNEHRI